MTLVDLMRLTRRRLAVLTALVLVCVLAALAVAMAIPPRHTASATAYVTVDITPAPDAVAEEYHNANQLASDKVTVLLSILRSHRLARAVADELGLGSLPGPVVIGHNEEELTITVSATAPTPEEARVVADEFVNQADLELTRLDGEGVPVHVVLMSSAQEGPVTRSPSLPRYLIIGLLVGLVVSYLVVLVGEALSGRLRSPAEISAHLDAPVLARLPYCPSPGPWRARGAGRRGVEDELRRLRANIVGQEGPVGRSLTVTASRQGEGASTISLGLARVMALAGHRVILVEADLRRPGLDALLGGGNGPGLCEVLTGAVDLERALRPTPVPGLHVLTAGTVPDNPSELLAGQDMAALLRTLAADHVVVVDTPPVGASSDSTVIAARTEATLLVVDAPGAGRDALAEAAGFVRQGGGRLLGVVLTDVGRAARRAARRVARADRERSE